MVPNGQNVKSGDVRLTDGHERARNFLSDGVMDALLEASKKGRHGVRDFLILLMMYRHGLRVSEAVRMRRQDLNLGARPGVDSATQEWPVCRTSDRRRRTAGHQALPAHTSRRLAVAVCLGTRAADDPAIAQLPHWRRCPACRTRGTSSSHAAAFLWLLPGESRLRPEADPEPALNLIQGLPRTPRPQAHGSLHEGRWRPVRGDVGDVRQGRGQGCDVNLALQDSYVVTGPCTPSARCGNPPFPSVTSSAWRPMNRLIE